MKITKDELLESDLTTLFTRDPAKFFEAVLVNLLWDNPGKIDPKLIERQKTVFLQWHEYYASDLRDKINQEVMQRLMPDISQSYNLGHTAGRIHALKNLPIRKKLFGKVIDVRAVTQLIDRLEWRDGASHS